MAEFDAPATPRREEAMDWGMTAEDIHTPRETLRRSISMFGMLLAECEAGKRNSQSRLRRHPKAPSHPRQDRAAILEAGIEPSESYTAPPDDGTHA
jgi:hypothetical protein